LKSTKLNTGLQTNFDLTEISSKPRLTKRDSTVYKKNNCKLEG